jgi:hypothetical protein
MEITIFLSFISAILMAVLGCIITLHLKIGGQEEYTKTNRERLDKMDKRIDRLDQRIEKIDSSNGKIDDLCRRLDKIEFWSELEEKKKKRKK